MVVGRLNRESNPVPGEKPGFKPQHKLPDGSFIDTGETNPLPTNDDLVLAKLAEMDTKIGTTNSRLNGVLDTNLVGAVGVNNFPTDQKINGIVGVNNFPVEQKVEVTNQKATQSVDGTVGINNYPVEQKVSDSDVLTKLSELDSKISGIIDGSTPANTQIVGSYKEYRILSTDTFPTANLEEKGALLIVMDTGDIYFNHGSSWEVF